jgi:hypothetical protein
MARDWKAGCITCICLLGLTVVLFAASGIMFHKSSAACATSLDAGCLAGKLAAKNQTLTVLGVLLGILIICATVFGVLWGRQKRNKVASQ